MFTIVEPRREPDPIEQYSHLLSELRKAEVELLKAQCEVERRQMQINNFVELMQTIELRNLVKAASLLHAKAP